MAALKCPLQDWFGVVIAECGRTEQNAFGVIDCFAEPWQSYEE